MELTEKIEGVLFFKAAPVKKDFLAKLFLVKIEAIEKAVQDLSDRLEMGATRLIVTEDAIELVTAPELDSLIEGLRREDVKRDIGKAGAETLAIVLYRGPVTRSEIDRIRGVNSSFILRNLQIRGLIERTTNGRQSEFRPTPDLLAHLGIKKRTEAPKFEEIMDTLEKYEKTQTTEPT